MLRCYPTSEPDKFDAEVRKPGQAWLAANPDKPSSKYKAFWSNWEACKEKLADSFQQRCAYTAMRILPAQDGTIDHYLSKKNYPELTYEWSNYRYCKGYFNGLKLNHDDHILDPFEVEDDWFEVQIPSLQLILTDKVPPELREKAEFTLRQLQLQDTKRIIDQRTEYYEDYLAGLVTLEKIERDAPLIAKAIRKHHGQ
jgi:hypothetical protein